jgi:hypothetical protein
MKCRATNRAVALPLADSQSGRFSTLQRRPLITISCVRYLRYPAQLIARYAPNRGQFAVETFMLFYRCPPIPALKLTRTPD